MGTQEQASCIVQEISCHLQIKGYETKKVCETKKGWAVEVKTHFFHLRAFRFREKFDSIIRNLEPLSF